MKFLPITLSITVLLIAVLTACGAGQTAETAPGLPSPTVLNVLTDPEQATQEAVVQATTDTPTPLPEATATVEVAPEVAATDTPLPTETPSPEALATNTVVPTATEPPQPTATLAPAVQLPAEASSQINVRSGPGTDYPVVGQLGPGEGAAVIGRNGDSSWWQIDLAGGGWVFGELVNFSGDSNAITMVDAPPPPPTATPQPAAAPVAEAEGNSEAAEADPAPQEAPEQLECGKDFCVTYQAMVPMAENGGCIGNHSIYITVLQGPPPGQPMDGVVIGDTYNNVEVGSGSNGPGRTEITLWMNSMTLIAKRHMDGTPYTSEESFNFTSHDELIPAEVLAANGYCEGNVEKCREAQQHNQVCRGHYSWRVTFHKFN